MERRLAALDLALLAGLVPIWAVCFGLSLRSLRDPPPSTPLGVRGAGANEYPVLIDLAPWADGGDAVLRRGDRLLRVGAWDLRGVGPLGFYARFAADAHWREPLPVLTYERNGVEGQTPAPPPIWVWPPLPASLGFFATCLLLSLRARPSPVTRTASRASLLAAIATALPVTGGVALTHAGMAIGFVAWSLAFPLLLRTLLLFTDVAPSGPTARLGPWIFAAIGPLTIGTLTGFPVGKDESVPLTLGALLAFCVVVLAVVAQAYRRADALGRRRLRWLALGFYGAAAPPAVVLVLLLADGLLFGEWRRFQVLLTPSYSFAVAIPLSLFFAVVRYNLFDIDRLLSTTASYNAALIAVVAIGLVAVPQIGELSSTWLGLDARSGQIAVSLALATLAVPLHQRLRPHIDRMFFKERHLLDQGVAELLRSIADRDDARSLTRHAGSELERLFHPEACVLYARVEESFAPVFATGLAVPPAFAATSPLVATLGERRAPLALSAAGRRPSEAALGPFDRAVLESLQAEVVAPVHRAGALVAFLCFGPKRSGDVYTQTDVTHLTAVAEAIGAQIHRFDQDALIREARAMQESLRRWVPGAVSEQIAGGAEPTSGEREVTVLFVDIRGYTSFADRRPIEDVFSAVNRYTELVSRIVRLHGGSVVEFNGDGMMAVFGAPRALAGKEASAVTAGREIAPAVGALAVGGENDHLSVGIGIATGRAFVGSIRAADRMIWTAIGSTTNLAARLQSLTRELGVSLIIDTATWQALGQDRERFQHHPAIAIRGRSQSEDVYALVPGEAVAPRQSGDRSELQ
jgi:class 3 adenylate cyclase